MSRRTVSVTLMIVVALTVVTYVAVLVGRGGIAAGGPLGGSDLLFVELDDGRNAVVGMSLTDPGGGRVDTAMSCQRVYSAAGTTVCLRLAGVGPSFEAAVTDSAGATRSVPLPGIPSRAQVSRSGQVVSWTSFVTGDSYSVPGGFSTRTGVLDLRSGTLLESIEHFEARIDGVPVTASDRNFWGVTVASDDRTFYATLATGGRTWLVKGDLETRTMSNVRPDAECPTLSADDTRIAYKKRIGRFGPWDLAVLDLRTGAEQRLPGTAGIDDQALWLDDERLAYGAKTAASDKAAIAVVPADGSAASRILVPNAMSPTRASTKG